MHKANAFNSYFSSIGGSIAGRINCEKDDHKNYLSGNYPGSFFFFPVSENDVYRIIISLKNKSSSCDNISVKVLKAISGAILPILTKLINKSLSSGIFPRSLKIANVIPLFKSGTPTLLENYRPISLLPLLSKIFEKVAHGQLFSYLRDKKILYALQFGFCPGRSTFHAMQSFLNYVYDNLDSDNYVFSMFLDFQKAFDCVDHSILLSKLHHYGVRGVVYQWFVSYLTGRRQFVSVDSCKSDTIEITCGVPQGSVLGPLLFLIFINDLPNATNFFKPILYADDSTLLCSFSKDQIPQISLSINEHLLSVNTWLSSNRLAINTSKTKYIVFSYRNDVVLPTIKIGDEVIEVTDQTKFLGLIIDSRLSFCYHVDFLASKISKTIGVLYKLRSFLPSAALLSLYQCLVFPYFTYGIDSWFATGRSRIQKLEVLQRKCIRAINFLDYNSQTNNFFKMNYVLKLNDLHFFHVCTFMYKSLTSAQNDFLLFPLLHHDQVHSHGTRNRRSLTVPRFNKTRSQCSIKYKGPKFWNSLSPELSNSNSIHIFKKRLKRNLISQYWCTLPFGFALSVFHLYFIETNCHYYILSIFHLFPL